MSRRSSSSNSRPAPPWQAVNLARAQGLDLRVYLDVENFSNISSGQMIMDVVKESHNFLLIITKDVFKDRIVLLEICAALQGGLNVVLLWDCDKPNGVPSFPQASSVSLSGSELRRVGLDEPTARGVLGRVLSVPPVQFSRQNPSGSVAELLQRCRLEHAPPLPTMTNRRLSAPDPEPPQAAPRLPSSSSVGSAGGGQGPPPLPPGYEYHAFITYRRMDGSNHLASYIKAELTNRGYSVFFDLESLRTGTFDTAILTALRASCCDGKTHDCECFAMFVIVPGTLDRCKTDAEGKDWVRLEIAEACYMEKPIIPVVEDKDNRFPDVAGLPSDMASFPRHNAMFFQFHLQRACMTELAERIDIAVRSAKPFDALPPPRALSDPKGLPAGWQEFRTDDGRGRPYYHHAASGETRWERPLLAAASSAPAPPPPPPAAPSGPRLPPGWVELWTPEGKPYYHHSASGTTTWDRPAG
eukprot:tig00001127_g7153.t1